MAEDLLSNVMAEYPASFSVVWDKDKKKPNYRNRRGIKSAYKNAFCTDYGDILKAIRSPGIDAVALLRNILVHKAGLADEEFIADQEKTEFSDNSSARMRLGNLSSWTAR